MPAARVAMRKIREVLRLHHVCGLSKRRIAPLIGIGPMWSVTTSVELGRPIWEGLCLRISMMKRWNDDCFHRCHRQLPRHGRLRIGPRSRKSFDAKTSRFGLFGKNTECSIRTALVTPDSVTCIVPGKAVCRRPCVRSTKPARRCLSTMPVKPCRSSQGLPVKSVTLRFSSPFSAPPISAS